jgi:hypothetical protein
MARVAIANSETRRVTHNATGKKATGLEGPMLTAQPISPWSTARLGVLGSEEVVVFKGTFNPVLDHVIGIRGNTDVGGGGRSWYLGGTETLNEMIR